MTWYSSKTSLPKCQHCCFPHKILHSLIYKIFFFIFIIAPQPISAMHTNGPIRIGVFPLEPINFINAKGEAAGIYPDLIREIANMEGMKVTFQKCNWAECLDNIQNGTLDIMTTVAYSEERAKIFDYNKEPVMDIWGQVFLRPNGTISNMLDLDKKTVAVMKKDINGKNFISTAKHLGVSPSIIELPSHKDVFTAVKNGEVAAGIAPQHFGMRHAKEYDLVASSIQFSPFSIYFASKKGLHSELLKQIDLHLAYWKNDKDSFYYQTINYWLGGKEFEKEIIPNWLLASIAAITIIALLLYFLNRLLHSKVKIRTSELEQEIQIRKIAEKALQKAHDELEKRVEERTSELQDSYEQLNLEKKRTQNYLNVASVMLIALDSDGKITLINPKGCEILETTEQNAIGINWFDNFIPHDLRNDLKKMYLKIMNGEIANVEFHENTILSSSGTIRTIAFHNSLLQDEQGAICGVLSSGADVTVQKQIEEEKQNMQAFLYQQEKMASVGQLAAGVAHEINNPMGFISSNLTTMKKYVANLTSFIQAQEEIITKSGEDISKHRELEKDLKIKYIKDDILDLVDESLEGATRVKEIVNNLKNFSRLDEAKTTDADINDCIESTLKVVWNELKYKVNLKKDYGTLPLLNCNPQQLNQVFVNLLVNAAGAIEENGDIEIKTWHENNSIHIAISDTGSGIDQKDIQRIFEPFFTTKEVGKGTGLGLSISFDIIKQHNGTISVDSQKGKGTTFTIVIPIAKPSAKTP